MPFDFEFFLHLRILFLSFCTQHSTRVKARGQLVGVAAASCPAGAGIAFGSAGLAVSTFAHFYDLLFAQCTSLSSSSWYLLREHLGYLKKQGKRRNQIPRLCVSVIIFFFCRVHGFESIVFLFYLWEQAELDNKQPPCQTARYRLSKLHKQSWVPFRLSQILNEGHVQTWPGMWHVCAAHPMGTRLNIPVYNLKAICLWAHLRIIQKQESFIHTQSTKISRSQKLSP